MNSGDWSQGYYNADLKREQQRLDEALNEGFLVISQQPFKSAVGEFSLYILHKPDVIEAPTP